MYAPPPPTRRERVEQEVQAAAGRPTSAYAERTSPGRTRAPCLPHHLRLRGEGEHPQPPKKEFDAYLRLRGETRRELYDVPNAARVERTTSAYAERTPCPRGRRLSRTHHLRLRGENEPTDEGMFTKTAPLPPTRRGHQVPAPAGPERTTSAYAERTLRWWDLPRPPAHHLRPRGENEVYRTHRPWRPHHLRLRGENETWYIVWPFGCGPPPPPRENSSRRTICAPNCGPPPPARTEPITDISGYTHERTNSACAERTPRPVTIRRSVPHHLRSCAERTRPLPE